MLPVSPDGPRKAGLGTWASARAVMHRHRPLLMAGAWQGVPPRVLAPHRGAEPESPTGLPFFSHPRRFAWGSLIDISRIRSRLRASVGPRPAKSNCADNGLAAAFHCYVFDCHMLFPCASMFLERLHLRRNVRSSRLARFVYSSMPASVWSRMRHLPETALRGYERLSSALPRGPLSRHERRSNG